MDRFVRRVAPELAADSAPQPVEVAAAAELVADSAPQPVESRSRCRSSAWRQA